MSWIEHPVRIERRSSINLCKFGAMRYSQPIPKKTNLQLARLPQEASCWLYLSGCQSSSSGRIFINDIFTSSGQGENSSWQLDWVRLLHLNKPSIEFQIPPRKLLDFGKKLPGRCIALTAGQEMELQMCYSFAAREGGSFCGFGFLEPFFWHQPDLGWNAFNSLGFGSWL